MVIVLYGTVYWNEIINFDALVRHGMIAPEDLSLLQWADDPPSALRLLQAGLAADAEGQSPAFASSRTSHDGG